MTGENKKNMSDNQGLNILIDSGLFDKVVVLDLESIINELNTAEMEPFETILSDGIFMKSTRGFELYNCNYFIWSTPLIKGDMTSPYKTILALTPNVEDDLHIIDDIINKAKFVKDCHENAELYPIVVHIS